MCPRTGANSREVVPGNRLGPAVAHDLMVMENRYYFLIYDKIEFFRPKPSGERKPINMMKRYILVLWLAVGCLSAASCTGMRSGGRGELMPDPRAGSLIRVNVARQGHHFHRPWEQRSPSTHTAVGVVIKGRRVLLTAQMLADHRYVELEKLDTGDKGRAEVEVIDYEANLALLKALDEDFLKAMRPLELTTEAATGDPLTILQVKRNGNVAPATSPVTSIELIRYPFGSYFLTYRLNGSLQYRFNNFTLPVLLKDKLAGFLSGYDAKAQTIDILSAPVIRHFIREASGETYRGFPHLGVHVVSAADPQLRRYAGIPEEVEGVFIQEVAKGGAAERAGLKPGDLITEMAGYRVDNSGNYSHPLYGKIALAHLIRCEFHTGDRVPVALFRDGKTMHLEFIPKDKPAGDFLVPPYVLDMAPRYYILGGLVLQELTLPYLQEYGAQWSLKAPIHLVNYQKNQHTMDSGGREKIVFLSQVLRTSQTIGYEGLMDLVITRINHHSILRLEDVPKALETPVEGFHRIEFKDHPKIIYVDSGEIEAINRQIRQRYQISTLQNLTPW